MTVFPRKDSQPVSTDYPHSQTSHEVSVICGFSSTLACFCLLNALGSTSAHADTAYGPAINIDFGRANPASPTFTGAGADPNDAGVIWNALDLDPTAGDTVSASNLLDSGGNSTGVGLTISGVSAVSTTGGTNPTTNALLQDYLVGQSSNVVLNLTGLTPFGVYRVYLYGAGSESGEGTTFSFNASATTSATARGDTFVKGVNYVELNTNTGDHGDLYLVMAGGTLPPVINGLQIQEYATPPSTFPSFSDAFDVSQGTVVLGGSPTVGNTTLESALGGVGTNTPEPDAAVFADSDPSGPPDYIEFRMPSSKTIQSINIFTNYDDFMTGGLPGTIANRGASRITLWAYDSATGKYDIKAFEIFPANPYTLTLAPPGSAVQDVGAPSLLVVTANINPVTTDRFRLEVVQAGSAPGSGVRFAELDGFTTLNPGLNNAAPVVTTASETTGQVGVALTFQLASSNNAAVSYAADGLPPGLSLDPGTGTISGVPTTAGTFDAAVHATNDAGAGPVASLRFDISARGDDIQRIRLISPPSNITIVPNQPIEVDAAISATAGTFRQVQFIVIDSANHATVLNTSQTLRATFPWQPATSGDYTLRVLAEDTAGQSKYSEVPIHVAASASLPPTIQLLSGVGSNDFALGSSFEVVASATDASGAPLGKVQFFLDGQPIPTTVTTTDGLAVDTSAHPAGAGPHRAEASSVGSLLAHAQLPLTGLEQLLTALVTDGNGVSSLTTGTRITAKAAPTVLTQFTFSGPDGVILRNGSFAPATVTVTAGKAGQQIAQVELFVDGASVGAPIKAAPYVFTLPALKNGAHVVTALATDASGVTSASPPLVVTAGTTVTVVPAGDGMAVEGGEKGKVFIERTGDTSATLTVSYKAKGSAVAGTDYKPLSGTVTIPAGASKIKVKVKPLENDVHDGVTKVKIKVLPAADGSYVVGNPFLAKVKIIDND